MPAVSKPAFTPLYAQIKDSILSRIVAGEWSPGSFLPSEMALAEEYGVSQGTLRKALNELTLEKRLVRYQGKGTAVAVLDADSSLFPFFMLYDAAGRRVYPLSCTGDIRSGTAEDDEAEALVRQLILRENSSGTSFGNARGVRNIFEKILVCQANRLAAMEQADRQALMAILPEDVRAAARESGTDLGALPAQPTS